MNFTCAADFRRAAQRRLPHFLFEYLDGGANEELTLRANVADLAQLRLRQRVLRNVAQVELTTSLFNQTLSMPVALAPIGIAGLCARRGERQAARAAAEAGIPFTLSTVSICSIEEVSAASARPVWFQLYVMRDRGFMRELLARAKQARAGALVFTVDMPVPGVRYRDGHSGMSGRHATLRRALQIATKPSWAWNVGLRGRPHALGNLASVLGAQSGLSDYMAWLAANFDPAIQWRDLDWLRQAWDGPLIIKGVLDADDARRAADMGAEGIVVSNHGGRQLDGVSSTARALPAIVDAVGSRLTVLADSGVRSGIDVLRLLALGARGVMLGRAWVFALGAGGGTHVSAVLRMIAHELRVAMALTGVRSIHEIDSSLLATLSSA